MNLSGLLPLIHNLAGYSRLVQELRQEGSQQTVTVLNAAKPYLLACLYRDLRLPMLIITLRGERAKHLHDELISWLGSDAPIQLFPEPDALPYEPLSSDSSIVQQRLRVLAALSNESQPPLIVTSTYAVTKRTIPHPLFISTSHVLRKGMRVDREQMLSRWVGMGYTVTNSVEVPGDLSRRGGIIDIYPPTGNLPARVEFLGDEVESIRLFDPATQCSIEPAQSIAIGPAREMLLPETKNLHMEDILASLDLSKCNLEAKERIRQEAESLLRGEQFDRLELYATLLNDGAITDYLPRDSLIVLDEPSLIEAEARDLDAQATELRRGQIGQGQLPDNFPAPYFTWPELAKRLEGVGRRLELEEWGTENRHLTTLASAPTYSGRLQVALEEVKTMLRQKRRLIIISQQASRLSELLKEQETSVSPVSEIKEPPPSGSLTLVQGALPQGWTMEAESGRVTLLTDSEVFGFSKQRRPSQKRPVRRQEFLSDLSVGDYVVHIEHGIARFAGMAKMGLDGREGEYLLLEYANSDKLYLPNNQVDRVSRYIGPGGYQPSLSRLGTQEWARAKQRVKEATENLAEELLTLYSAREVVPGFAFSTDTVWQQELEASFPYVETRDQLEAVRGVKQDMEKAKPMDRLVCGDVGYGKTEVALRASFKAVMDGMQVALLVPTTVLAQQHFATFTQRLGAFPIRVEVLSRFRSEKEQRHILKGLENGTVDICIGTHRLLQKDVAFKNLGLVVIDEEQRFGVAHKEHLKKMRQAVDVLTLTATPIPRTLHMSLIGVRDMSTMETPPEERLPIKTYVTEYDERLIREAILRELERNGQVYFVHNRVQNISYIATRLMELAPEAEIAVAHGQMPEEELESVMLGFSAGKSDVLVCTTIIESGIDMPNVNTLIVNQADKLGLTQLYQLRGRVGRGANRAYAYFLFAKGKHLTEAAEKRLRTIFEATELGSGFRIAMKDLEIRGAGNLLGAEQSGHIGAVGFNLYCQLLAEAVEQLKGREPTTLSLPTPTIDLPLPAHIPEEYVADVSARLALYRKLAKISSLEEVESMDQELGDRFGQMPAPVKNLLYMVKAKVLGAEGNVQSISTEGEQVVIKMRQGLQPDRAQLEQTHWPGLKIGLSQVRLDMKRIGKKWREVLVEVLERMAPP